MLRGGVWEGVSERGLGRGEVEQSDLHFRHRNSNDASPEPALCSSSNRIFSASGAWPHALLSSISR